jgi:DNA-binding response OmpR family regulator
MKIDVDLTDCDREPIQYAGAIQPHGALPVPIVILTTSGHPRDVADCTRLGAADYLVKPFDRATFAERLQAFVQVWFTPEPPPRS